MRNKTFARAHKDDQEHESKAIYRSAGDSEEAYIRDGSRNINLSSPEALAYFQKNFPAVYSRLKVSRPEDEVEKEADRIADEAMARAPRETAVVSGAAGADTPGQPTESSQGGERSQPSMLSALITPNLEMPENSGAGSMLAQGTPLPDHLREAFETKLGRDLRGVRIHTDGAAAVAAKGINAKAFTVGRDIVFGAGQFSPGTPSGNRLIAHELAHVGQQGDTGNTQRSVHRQQEEPPTQREEAKNTVSPETLRVLVYSKNVLSKTPKLSSDDKAELDKMVGQSTLVPMLLEQEKKRKEIESTQQILSTKTLPGGVGDDHETSALRSKIEKLTDEIEALESQIQTQASALGVPHRAGLVDYLREEFPKMWKERAAIIATSMLNENLERVQEEKAKYPENVCSINILNLQEADRVLEPLYTQMRSDETAWENAYEGRGDGSRAHISHSISPLASWWSAIPVPAQAFNDQETKTKSDAFVVSSHEYARALAHYGAESPILYNPDYTPGMFQGKTQDDIVEQTGALSDEVIENIEDTMDDINDGDFNLWQLPLVRQMTFQDLGVPEDSILGEMVKLNYQEEAEDEARIKTILTVLEVGVTIGAGIINPALGMAAGAAFALAHTLDSVNEYLKEAAAENTAFDVEAIRDLSANDPDLMWVVLDLAALGFELTVIGKFVSKGGKLLSGARLLKETGDSTLYRQALKETVGEAGEELAIRAERRLLSEGVSQSGSGGNWPVIDEVVDKSVKRQLTENACGPAGAQMLLEDAGIEAAQSQIVRNKPLDSLVVDSRSTSGGADLLAASMNKISQSNKWRGGGVDIYSNPRAAVQALSENGSFMVRMDSIVGGRFAGSGHFVVVDGFDDLGRVIIRDPAEGTKYFMNLDDFAKHQTDMAVWQK